MTKLNRHEIRKQALEIVDANPGGIRHSELLKRVHERSPETPFNSIRGALWNLDSVFPDKVKKPTRGLFIPADAPDTVGVEEATEEAEEFTPKGVKITESDFYQPFADWLKADLDEVTTVTSLGGAGLGSKWGTPDVVGAYKPLASHLVKFPLEIVSAELKINRAAPVVAFGQAVAYRLFSAKTYIVMPTTLTEVDQSRLEALCMHFGVGLVLFDLDPKEPNFSIRVRAQRFSPDMFYVNEFAERLKTYDSAIFEQIFG
jgi:hypothetical protein